MGGIAAHRRAVATRNYVLTTAKALEKRRCVRPNPILRLLAPRLSFLRIPTAYDLPLPHAPVLYPNGEKWKGGGRYRDKHSRFRKGLYILSFGIKI